MLQLLTAFLSGTTALAASTAPVAAVSWGPTRVDVFGLAKDKTVWHKYNPGDYWRPEGFDNMNGTAFGQVTAVSWGANRVDYFVIGSDDAAYHKYWDGYQWSPPGLYHEQLQGIFTSHLAATSWGEGRVDIFGRGTDNQYYHKYWDGSSWQPTGKYWERFGGDFDSAPSAVSWGKDRFDVVGINSKGKLLHKYWNGDSYSDWEDMDSPSCIGEPLVSSWGSGNLDFWIVDAENHLQNRYWRGDHYSDWIDMGGNFSTSPKAVHWASGRIDLVGRNESDGNYLYKYFDGSQWNPSLDGWYTKGGPFANQPALVSTRENELHILGVDNDDKLKWQVWTGYNWYPDTTEFLTLGDTGKPAMPALAMNGEL